jgi:hypothetical protein
LFKIYAGGGDPAVPASNGTLTGIWVYCDDGGAGTGTIDGALYEDSSGSPGALRASSSGGAVAVPATAAWVHIPMSAYAIVAGTTYIICIKSVSIAHTEIYFDAGGSGDNYWDASAFTDPWSGGGFATDLKFSVYAEYTPAAPASSSNMFFGF